MALQGKFYDARLFAGAYELTGQSNTIQLSYNAAMLDVTTMGMTTKSNLAGIKDVKLDAAGFMVTPAVTDLTDQTLFANVGLATIPVSFFPTTGSIEGSLAYLFSAAQPDYTVGGAHGAMAPYKFSAVPGSLGYPLVRGYVLEPGSVARVATGAGSGTINPGAAAATQRMYAALHVFSAVVGGGNTLDVIIQSDADGAFPAGSTTRFTFTQATGITSQYMMLAGPVTDAYWRASWTIAGATPSFRFAVVLGII
jgi:hypothetical protein